MPVESMETLLAYNCSQDVRVKGRERFSPDSLCVVWHMRRPLAKPPRTPCRPFNNVHDIYLYAAFPLKAAVLKVDV